MATISIHAISRGSSRAPRDLLMNHRATICHIVEREVSFGEREAQLFSYALTVDLPEPPAEASLPELVFRIDNSDLSINEARDRVSIVKIKILEHIPEARDIWFEILLGDASASSYRSSMNQPPQR